MCRNNKNCAIAIFDSGVGGITIMREIRTLLPHENLIYYADAGNCPYGGRPAEEIVALSKRVVDFLLTMEVKIIVVACNTATTNAITQLRIDYPQLRFVGTEPAVKPAVKNSHSGVVGVLATRSTISSRQISALSQKYGDGKVVLEQAGDGLVELVERGEENSPEAVALLAKYINPMLEKGIDYLALGCTHYPFMIDSIEKVIEGRGVT
ncbi:MAG: glutamate racemase, partial [Rikenellaceae bacterium]